MKIMNKFLKLLFHVYIAILSAIPTQIGVLLRYYAYKSLFKEVKGKFFIDSGVTILGFEKIVLGNNVSIQKNSYLYANDGGNLILGNDLFLGTNSQLCAVRGNITIGNDVLIASNCVLRPDNHKFLRKDELIRKQGYDVGNITIGNDVWISSNAVILKDVIVQNGCIIGAGSVVTKNIEEYSIVVGIPAKLIKKRH